MVELRKRAAPPPAAPPAKKKTATATAKARAGKKGAGAGNDTASETKSEPATSELAVGQKVGANGLAAAIETHDGRKVTLQSLLDEADKQVRAVAIFTYPKASTPGCTTQAQLFRDAYPQLQTAGLAVFGLSADSTKANTTFCTKQKLPYTLLCDTAAHLIRALGLHKHPNSTRRGVVVLDRSAVVQAYTQAGPAATLDAVQEWVKEHGGGTENGGDDVPAATAAKSGTDDAGKGGEDGTAKSDKLADAVGDAAAPAVEADAETKLKEDGPKAE